MGYSRVPSHPAAVSETAFRSLDGLELRGTLVTPSGSGKGTAILVHGGGVTKEEGGFYTRLGLGLADAGISSLRFDLRGHGESEGRQEDLTISGIANDIRAAIETTVGLTGSDRVSLIAASFSGGIAAFYASRYPDQLNRLVLFNPLLNYKRRFIDDKPYWLGDHIDAERAHELAVQGYIAHSPTFRLGRPLLNEIFYLQPHMKLGKVVTPTLIVHGTRDTFIPIEASRAAVAEIAGGAELIEIDGAQHGIAVHDDPQYLDPRTQEWQAFAIRTVADWLAAAA
jgi:pimeloyl-ACP methyl ester carboxylesterase